MVYFKERLLWCVICGVPIFTEDTEDIPWLKQATVLTDIKGWPPGHWRSEPGQSQPDDGIIDLRATLKSFKGGKFQLRDGRYIEVCDVDRCSNTFLFLPTHEACLHIAKKVIQAPSRRSSEECSEIIRATSMRRLWEILHARFEATARSKLSRYTPYVFGPHDYYIKGTIDFHNWECSSIGEREVYEADPVEIPDLAAFILSLRVPLPNSGSQYIPLPPGIARDIIELVPFINRKCERCLPPMFWRQIFLDGTLLPFLWDLNPSEEHGINWDYEHLVRELAQVEYGPGEKVPPRGLRNRRRIWRLVEEMYIGDVCSSSIY